MIKNPIHIQYSKRCYYCICQACNRRKCPYTAHKALIDVCMRCNRLKAPKARLDCDFFEHFRKHNVYYVRASHVHKDDVKNQIYCVVQGQIYYGPFDLKKAHEFKRKRGGVIKILNITDYSENW